MVGLKDIESFVVETVIATVGITYSTLSFKKYFDENELDNLMTLW
jgi:hypothetical protein